MSVYDKYYKQENYFKYPCPELIEFFMSLTVRGKLCDLGAGQGRDSIPLHEAGYDVTAVDISKVGLKQIKKASPGITVVLSDIYTYDISDYDFILMDSMLHFYKKDIEKESALVKSILSEMKAGRTLANNMVKSEKAEKILKNIISSHEGEFEIISEKHIDYPDYASVYHFIAIRKKY